MSWSYALGVVLAGVFASLLAFMGIDLPSVPEAGDRVIVPPQYEEDVIVCPATGCSENEVDSRWRLEQWPYGPLAGSKDLQGNETAK